MDCGISILGYKSVLLLDLGYHIIGRAFVLCFALLCILCLSDHGFLLWGFLILQTRSLEGRSGGKGEEFVVTVWAGNP